MWESFKELFHNKELQQLLCAEIQKSLTDHEFTLSVSILFLAFATIICGLAQLQLQKATIKQKNKDIKNFEKKLMTALFFHLKKLNNELRNNITTLSENSGTLIHSHHLARALHTIQDLYKDIITPHLNSISHTNLEILTRFFHENNALIFYLEKNESEKLTFQGEAMQRLLNHEKLLRITLKEMKKNNKELKKYNVVSKKKSDAPENKKSS